MSRRKSPDEGSGSSALNESPKALRDDDDDYDSSPSNSPPDESPADNDLYRPIRRRPSSKSSTQLKRAPPKGTLRSRITINQAAKPTKIAKASSKSSVSSLTPTASANTITCPHCSSGFLSQSTLKKHVLASHTRPFVCIFHQYGCPATVGSKNEWKRHINVQHMHLEIWRCDIGECASTASKGSPSHDFDRKDLFTQHLKRMHSPPNALYRAEKAKFEASVEAIQKRCHRELRNPPTNSICPYCPGHKVFENWDDRIEHVGKHLERGDFHKSTEVEDMALRDWLTDQGYLVWRGSGTTTAGWRLVDTGKKRRRGQESPDEEDEDARRGFGIVKGKDEGTKGQNKDVKDENDDMGGEGEDTKGSDKYSGERLSHRPPLSEHSEFERRPFDAGEISSMGTHNDAASILTAILAETPGCTVRIDALWNLPNYVKTELGGDRELGRVLTLTGNRQSAYAATCADYMKWRWPKTGALTLARIEAFLINHSEVHDEIIISKRTHSSGAESTVFHIRDPLEAVLEITEQISWLCAVFQKPRFGRLSASTINFKRTGPCAIELSSPPLRLIDGDTETSCWHSLFINGVVAQDFPIPSRLSYGQLGLELPFATMIKLAGVIRPDQYDGGLVLQGFSSLLFPTVVRPTSVQWHYISSGSSDTKLSTSCVSKFSRVKGAELEDMLQRRMFLGFCKEVDISLGTGTSSYDRIKYSLASKYYRGAGVIAPALKMDTISSDALDMNPTATMKYPRAVLATAHIDGNEDTMRTTEGSSLLLNEARANDELSRLVTKLCAILNMAYIWAIQAKATIDCSILHTVLQWDCELVAPHVFYRNGGRVLHETSVEERDCKLKDLIPHSWGEINKRFEEQKHIQETSPAALKVGFERFRGWESTKIARPSPSIDIKMQKVQTDCGWNLLEEEAPIWFCQSLREPIEPVSETRVCPIPQGQDLIMATLTCFAFLSKRREASRTCRNITDRLYWQPVGSAVLRITQTALAAPEPSKGSASLRALLSIRALASSSEGL